MIVQATPSARVSLRGKRRGNEDAVLSVRLSDGRHLCAVADGMGGHRCGEVASALALEALQQALEDGRTLRDAVEAANAAVHAEAARNPERAGMGTTLVALLSTASAYEVANVGDSRAYRVDAREIRQITVDHSFAAEAARTGSLSPEEVARSPWRNALTRSLGTQPEVEVDVFGPYAAGGPGHLVLLCSDGLYRALPDPGLREHLLAAAHLEEAVRSLAELALQRGSDDNVSAVVTAFGTPFPAADAASGPARRVAGAAARPVAPAPCVPRHEERLPSPGAIPVSLAAPVLAVRAARDEGRWAGGGRTRESRAPVAWARSLFREQHLFLLCVAALLFWFVSLLTHP